MLAPIQPMEYYLRTSFGESKTFSGGAEYPKQGACQGNTTASATWQQISSVLVRTQDRAGHGINVVTPITERSKRQVGVLFVDDTILWEGLGEEDDINDIDTVMEKGQRSINTWGNNLLTVGDEMRPEKCSYNIHEMRSMKNGKWEYVKTTLDKQGLKGATADEPNDLWGDMDAEELDELKPPRPRLIIPLASGDAAAIKKLSNDNAEENLGMKV